MYHRTRDRFISMCLSPENKYINQPLKTPLSAQLSTPVFKRGVLAERPNHCPRPELEFYGRTAVKRRWKGDARQ